MSARGDQGRAARTAVLMLVAVVIGILIAQLGGRVYQPEPGQRQATVPKFRGDLTDRRAVLAYARGLPYDTAHGVIDEQYLTPVRVGKALAAGPVTSGEGPLARVEPMRESYLFTRVELSDGRVVARMINRDSLPYPSLALAAYDTTYMWVDSAATGRWRALYLSSHPEISARTVGLTVMRTASGPGGKWPFSLARWLSLAGGGQVPWVPCTMTGCCWPDAQ